MQLLYRGHPTDDCLQKTDDRELSFSENKEVATNYAKDYFRDGNKDSTITTVEFHGTITLSNENRFRGPDSFKYILSRYPKHKHDAVKTGDGTLVVVYNLEKLKKVESTRIDQLPVE